MPRGNGGRGSGNNNGNRGNGNDANAGQQSGGRRPGGGGGGGGTTVTRPGGGGAGSVGGRPVRPSVTPTQTSQNLSAPGSTPTRPSGFNPSGGIVGNAINMVTAGAQAPAGSSNNEVTDPWATSTITKQQAIDFATDMLKLWGLESLGVDVNKLVDDYGDNTALYEVGIRQTEGYQKRFKGLNDLRKSGNTYGITSEGEYLALENQYRTVFRNAGISNMLISSDGTDYTNIADLVSKFNTSSQEVASRIADAQRVVNNTPQEVKNALRDFYNINDTDLLSYTLDPTKTAADINAKANASLIAGLGRTTDYGVNITQQAAEQYAKVFGESGDISQEQMRKDLAASSTLQKSMGRLAGLEKETFTGTESLQATTGIDAAATEKAKRLQSAERARFSGSSAIQQKTLRRGGI